MRVASRKKMAPVARMAGMLLLVLAAGCAGVKETSTSAIAQTGPLMVHPSLIAPGPSGAKESGTKEPGTEEKAAAVAAPLRPEAKEQAAIALALPATGSRGPAMTGDKAIGTQPVAAAPAAPAPSSKSPGASAAAPSAKASAAPAVVAQPRNNENPLPAARTPEPPLDVAALKARLRDTDAIGVFTKLALGNQVDDLLKQFRQIHQSGKSAGVASLRQPYNLLVLKVLALVQDRDPSLARTISGSREAIWSILADPVKFNSVA
jgi:hypothetical protein